MIVTSEHGIPRQHLRRPSQAPVETVCGAVGMLKQADTPEQVEAIPVCARCHKIAMHEAADQRDVAREMLRRVNPGPALKHLLVLDGGAPIENKLFLTGRDRAEHVQAAFIAGEYPINADVIEDFVRDSAYDSDPNPSRRIERIREWLSEEGVELFLEEVQPPMRPTD